MEQYISKDVLVAEIEKEISIDKIKCQQSQEDNDQVSYIAWSEHIATCGKILSFLNTLEVIIDPYEQCIQYASIEGGIKAQAEDYSFNIESVLFNQLTKEQQALWRKEIEQACISGGYSGYSLARDPRYKENLEVKEVNLDLEITLWANAIPEIRLDDIERLAKHFFELGLSVNNKAEKGE